MPKKEQGLFLESVLEVLGEKNLSQQKMPPFSQ